MDAAQKARPDAPSSLREIGGFELIEKIGQGGMGTVFKARQKSLDRIVALKLLPPSIAKDAKFTDRFQREARACAKLNHPNIVLGVDVGQDAATGVWYFAMEFVDGPSALKLLKKEKVIPEQRALEIARDMARALECAAAHKIVHRDIKPDNILLTEHGEAKLADLGLARQMNEQDASLTQSGQVLGTPFYMAPEQVRGQAEKFDTRTDIYALGGTLFHLVTGQPPYSGETGAAIMARHLADPVPKANKVNPAVSESCSRLIERMMQKEREQRIQTPAELLTQIERVLSGDTVSGRHRGKSSGAAPRRKKEKGEKGERGEKETSEQAPVEKKSSAPLVLGVGAAAAVLILVLIFCGSSSRPETKRAPENRVASPAPIEPPKPIQRPAPAPAKPVQASPARAMPASEPVESMPTSMLPLVKPTEAADAVGLADEGKAPSAAIGMTPEKLAAAAPSAPAPSPAPAAAPAPAKMTEWPLADIFGALRENAPAKALERIKEGNHVGKEVMLDALKLLVAQRDARIAAFKNLVGQFVKLDTAKGPQNGKLVSFENNTLNLEREIIINGESRGSTKVAIAMDDLLPACRERLAPTPAPGNSTAWLAAALSGMAERQLDAAETALSKVEAAELRDILSSELKRTRVAERETQAAAAWAKVLTHAAEANSQTKAKQLLEELNAFAKQFASSDFALNPEVGLKAKELTEQMERLSLGLDPRVLKLFKGRVLNYDPRTQVITLGYDLQTKEQTEDFIDTVWAPPGDTTGVTWKKGELKTFCKSTADCIFKMPQFASGTLNIQLDYKKTAFSWKHYEVEISFYGLDSQGKTPKASFRGTEKGAFFTVNGNDVKTNTDEPAFAKDGTLELTCQGQALQAKVNGKAILEHAMAKPNDHSGFWIGGGWDSGITFTRIQISARLDPVWLAKALEKEPKGR